MSWRMLLLRFVCLAGLALWVGGFTFYGAFVIPVLHDELDSLQAGGITRRVTDALNAIGAAALVFWWICVWAERALGGKRLRVTRVGLLLASTATLAFLAWLHTVMDHKLDNGEISSFYPWHRVYLIASTVQWAANLGVLFVALMMWCRTGMRLDAAPGDTAAEA